MPHLSAEDLVYGHLGKAVYDSETAQWHFSRLPGLRITLESLGGFSWISTSDPHNRLWSRGGLASSRTKAVADLTKYEPVLSPAARLLYPLVQVSEAVSEAQFGNDLLISERVALGQACDFRRDPATSQNTDVIAVASGPAGDSIIFVSRREASSEGQQFGRPVTRLGNSDFVEQGIWVHFRTPIQQLCFSTIEDRPGSWLAVRYATSTTIVRPAIQDTITALSRANNGSAFITEIGPSAVVDLSIDATGGEPHVDVTFNPWNQCELAVLDTKGRWSIWSVSIHPYWREIVNLDRGPSGSSSECGLDDRRTENGERERRSDGWGMILWVRDTNTIIVARRGRLALCTRTNGSVQCFEQKLGVSEEGDWILDVRRDPLTTGQIFVLTSASIFWLKIGTEETSPGKCPLATILLSRPHFRTRGDFGLRMALTAADKVRAILLYSRSSSLITGFTFNNMRSSPLCQSTSDPFVLQLDVSQGKPADGRNAYDTEQREKSLSSVLLLPATFTNPPCSGDSEEQHIHLPPIDQTYHLIVLHKDLSVSGRLYALAGSNGQLTSELSKGLGVCSSTSLSKPSAYSVADRPDEFRAKDRTAGLETSASGRNRRNSSSKGQDQWIAEFQWLAEDINDISAVDKQRATSADLPFNTLQSTINEVVQYRRGTHVLSDLLPNMKTNDIYAASGWIDRILQSLANGSIAAATSSQDDIKYINRAKSRSLTIPVTSNTIKFGIHEDDADVITSLYEKLLHTWIAPLQASVSNRARLAFEKRVRKVSIDLFLSLHGVQCDQSIFPTYKPLESVELCTEIDLPVRRKRSVGSATGKSVGTASTDLAHKLTVSNPLQAMQPMPRAPEHTSAPPSPTSDFPARNMEYTPNGRLGKFADVKSPTTFSRSFSNMVGDWQVGVDPADYNSVYLNRLSNIHSDGDDSDAKQLQKQRQIKKRTKRRASSVRSDSTVNPNSGPLASESISQQSLLGRAASQTQPAPIRARKPSAQLKKRRPGFG